MGIVFDKKESKNSFLVVALGLVVLGFLILVSVLLYLVYQNSQLQERLKIASNECMNEESSLTQKNVDFSDSETSGKRVYKNAKYGFSFECPEDFVIEEFLEDEETEMGDSLVVLHVGGGTAHEVPSIANMGEQLGISVYRNNNGLDPGEVYSTRLSMLESAHTVRGPIPDSKGPVNISGVQGYSVDLDFGPAVTLQVETAIVNDSYVVIFSYPKGVETYPETMALADEYNQVVNSLKFEE